MYIPHALSTIEMGQLKIWNVYNKWKKWLPGYKVWSLWSKGFTKYWVNKIFWCWGQLDSLTHFLVTSKSIEVIYSWRGTNAPCSKSIQWSVFKILSRQSSYMQKTLTSELWPCIKINNDYIHLYIYFIGYTCIPSLMSMKQRVLIEQAICLKQLNPDLWPCELKKSIEISYF